MNAQIGKFLIVAGFVAMIVGAWLWSGRGFGPLGRLPGDIRYERDGVGVYVPIMTCIVISAVLSLIGWLFRR